ncbi:MAG: hypothetical protein KC912_09215 [Proteobacteria bacterium]|nr:hypothetical protein [Pseudomonadota bacterium]
MRVLLALLLVGCGSQDGTWLLDVDRAALVSDGCSTGTLGGDVQFEASLFRDGDAVSMWVPARQALLTGTWSKDALELAQEDDQGIGGVVIGLSATGSATEFTGDWLEASPNLAEPTCTRTYPLTGTRLSNATVAP